MADRVRAFWNRNGVNVKSAIGPYAASGMVTLGPTYNQDKGFIDIISAAPSKFTSLDGSVTMATGTYALRFVAYNISNYDFYIVDGPPTLRTDAVYTINYALEPVVPQTYTIIHDLDDGIESAEPAAGSVVWWPSSPITASAVPKEGFTVASVQFYDGTTPLGVTITPVADAAYTVKAVSEPIPPEYYSVSVSVTGLGANGCGIAQDLLRFDVISGGGSIDGPGGASAVTNSPSGSASASSQVESGSSSSVFACANDVWTRLVSLVINGNDYVSNPSGGSLTDAFAFTSPGSISGGVYFTVDQDITATATFAKDVFCWSGKPNLPNTGAIVGPGTGGAGGGDTDPGPAVPPVYYPPGNTDPPYWPTPDPAPPTDPPTPPPPPVPPPGPNPPPPPPVPPPHPVDEWALLRLNCYPAGAGTYTGQGYYTKGRTVSFQAWANTGWEFVRWAGDENTTSTYGTTVLSRDKSIVAYFTKKTVIPPEVGPLPFPPGIDWDLSRERKGLIVRWKDDDRPWSKEKYVTVVVNRNVCARLKPHGHFYVRKYEFTHVDSLPVVIGYIETDPEVKE